MLSETTALLQTSYRYTTTENKTGRASSTLTESNKLQVHPVEGLRNTPAAVFTIGLQLWAAHIAIKP